MSSCSGGAGHDLELRDGLRALPERGADAVRAGVAAADHDDMPAAGENVGGAVQRLRGDAAVLLRQEIHREVNAGEVAAGDREIAAGLGAAGQRDRVIFLDQLLRIDAAIGADESAVMERDALGLHLGDAAVDDVLFHLEVGNAVTQQSAGLGVLLIEMHVVAGARELLRAGEARGAGADHGDLLAGLLGSYFRLQPAVLPGAVDDGAFDRLDGDRVLVDVERAGGLARRRADAAGELRKIVGGVQVARGFFPVALIDEVVEVGDLVVDRAARRARRHRAGAVAIGDAAIHAARGLVARVLLGQRNDEFLVVLHTLGDRRVLAVVPLDLEETSDLAHLTLTPLHHPFVSSDPHPEERPRRVRSDEGLHGCLMVRERIASLARHDGYIAMLTPRSRSSARRRPSPSSRAARGGTPPASPCGTWAANSSNRRGYRRRASSPSAWRDG